MCTGFIVLQGTFHGRHYDRLETHKDHYLIKPTIDREFEPGEPLDHLRPQGQHPLVQGGLGRGYIFNVHVIGYDPTIKGRPRPAVPRPGGREAAGGLIKARR